MSGHARGENTSVQVRAAASGTVQVDRDGRVTSRAGDSRATAIAADRFAALPDEPLETLRRAIAEADPEQSTHVAATIDGIDWLLSVSRDVDASGESGAVRVLIRDTTRENRLASELRSARKLEAVGQLAGGVAHDFNNLLTVILTYADALLYELPEVDPRRRDVDEIRIAGGRAVTLTRQLLAFSRRTPSDAQKTDVNDVVEGVSKMLARLIGANIELKYTLDPTLGSVFIDPGLIEHVVVNLIVLARETMPDGGRVGIATANVWLETGRAETLCLDSGHYARLSVTDSGEGHGAEQVALLCQLGRRDSPDVVPTPDALGLDMLIGAIRGAGGAVSVESGGSGTRFDIFVPQMDETSSDDSRAPARSTQHIRHRRMATGRGTILLVEDEAALRRLTARVLRDQGYTVLAARDGEHALAKASIHGDPVDLLVTDLVMPRMGGREVAKMLQRINPDVRVLFTSGYGGDSVAEATAEEGCGFLGKPYTRNALLEDVRTLLNEASPN